MTDNSRSRYSTANEFLALEDIDACTGSLKSLLFLYEAARGTVEATGDPAPFLQITLAVDGVPQTLQDCQWEMLGSWIPRLSASLPAGRLHVTYLTPPGERGCLIRAEFLSASQAQITLGFKINWSRTRQISNAILPAEGSRRAGRLAAFSTGVFLGFRGTWPMFGMGLVLEPEGKWDIASGSRPVEGMLEVAARTDEVLVCEGIVTRGAASGETVSADLHLGLGLEAYAGMASARNLLYEGWDSLFQETLQWLSERQIAGRHAAESMLQPINEASLYNYFFCHGASLDTERLSVMSSRSVHDTLTGSYHDREACLCSLPGVLLVDPERARRLLEYVFSVQIRNVGGCSRYSNGVPLEPGFMLDGLITPIRILWMYVDLTGDQTILFDQQVQSGINRILEILDTRSHPSVALYSSRLTPAARAASLPYITYNNVLIWRALVDLSDLYHRIRDMERAHETETWARDVRVSVLENCIVEGPEGRMFCFSTDLSGGWELGDEPEGSLMLLAHLEFCRSDFRPFLNTLKWVREQNRKQHPGTPERVLTLANELLTGNTEPLDELRGLLPLQPTAEGYSSALQESSATSWTACRGYVVYAIVRALEDHLDLPVLSRQSRRGSRISRTTIRPGVGWV